MVQARASGRHAPGRHRACFSLGGDRGQIRFGQRFAVHPQASEAIGPGKTHQDGLDASMVTVLRADGLRIVIYANDHLPAHVHVLGDGEAKIDLTGGGTSGPRLVWAEAMSRADIRRALRLVAERRAFLLARWEEIHGRRR